VYRKRRRPPYDVCELDEQEVIALLPPADAEDSAAWALATTRKLRDANKIPEGITKTKLALLLEGEADKAVKTGQLRRALKHTYIENQLSNWGIWPLSSFH